MIGSQYVDIDLAVLRQCMASVDGVPVHRLYWPNASVQCNFASGELEILAVEQQKKFVPALSACAVFVWTMLMMVINLLVM